MVSLTVDLAPHNPRELRLRNPILTASGCLGFGTEAIGVIELERLGAFVSSSLTLKPWRHEWSSRVVATPAGVLYTNRLPNPGLRAFLRTYPRIYERWAIPVIVSIAGSSIDEFASLAEALDEVPGIAGIETNLSMPIRGETKRQIGDDPELTFSVVDAVRMGTSAPVIAKLNFQPGRIAECAVAAEAAGADAISLINAIDGLAIDRVQRRAIGDRQPCFLVGPAIKPLALLQVHEVVAAVAIPVIGGGGIASLDDALDHLMAGASAVQIGSALFADPGVAERLVDELPVWMTTNGIERIDAIVGVARAADRDIEQFQREPTEESTMA